MSEKFISAQPESDRSVVYQAADGRKFKYSGGDPAWRTNNPGNLWSGPVSKRNGEIGKFGHFAIFPDYEHGHDALLDSLKTTYGKKSLEQMIRGYAPKHENKTEKYLRFLKKKTGVKGDKKINDFAASEFEKLWRAIELYEGSKPGTVKELSPGKTGKQITKVRKNRKGTIIAYFVESVGWCTKGQAIRLARAGQIDAVIARSRDGNLFLRTRPGTPVKEQLDNLG